MRARDAYARLGIAVVAPIAVFIPQPQHACAVYTPAEVCRRRPIMQDWHLHLHRTVARWRHRVESAEKTRALGVRERCARAHVERGDGRVCGDGRNAPRPCAKQRVV
jgi:hypothetical protein